MEYGRTQQINFFDIGQRIRKARIKKGVTQEQLAAQVDVGTTHISHIETGNTIPSMKTFIAIVDALGISADDVLCDNLAVAKKSFVGEIADELEDCTESETRIIADMVKALKASLRRRTEG